MWHANIYSDCKLKVFLNQNYGLLWPKVNTIFLWPIAHKCIQKWSLQAKVRALPVHAGEAFYIYILNKILFTTRIIKYVVEEARVKGPFIFAHLILELSVVCWNAVWTTWNCNSMPDLEEHGFGKIYTWLKHCGHDEHSDPCNFKIS